MAESAVTSPEVILSQLDSLPTLPAVALQLIEMTAAEDKGAGDLIQLLRGDQSLTAKILSVASSAAYGARPVNTLERAVPLLGFSGVRSIALATGVFACFARGSAPQSAASFDLLEFWKHALAVACGARRLAAQRRELAVDPEDAFIAGLLHDLGKVALSSVFPKAYDRAAAQANHSRGDIADFERGVLGADHTVAGRRVAERWRLPRHLQDAIWLHHLAADALPASVGPSHLIALVQLADTVAREQRIGYSGNHLFYEMSPRLADRLGFTTAHVEAVVASLATDVAEHATRLGLAGETPQAVYLQAMTRANAELGRLNSELLAGNRRLATGARYFRAVAQFEQHLSDWADPAAVVAAVAQAAALALQRTRVVALGFRDGLAAADICWHDPQSEFARRSTAVTPPELAEWAARFRPGTELLVPAPREVRALVGPEFEQRESAALWLAPVMHHGELAGLVVYASQVDERLRLGDDADEFRSFIAHLGLALGRANAQSAARRLSEDLAAANRRLQQMQVELLRSRTLSMIAEMAAGAGHELNSPLTVISGRAQMLATELRDPEAQRVLNVISLKAHECSGIVSELMDFARPRAPQLASVDLRELLTEVRDHWRRTSGLPPSRLRLPESAAEPAALVLADPTQLRSVCDELVSNALDAVAETSGTITLRYQPAVVSDAWELLVEDTGCGMNPTVLQRAFDPFFSSRKAGRRRGLGLPRAYRIVEAHGGKIWLESRPDEGTTAHVLLPRPSRPAAPAGPAAPLP